MSYTIYEGTAVRFDTSKTPFTSYSGTIVTPDVVTFTYYVQGQTEVTYTWTNPTGDPTGTIVNYGTGLFYVVLQTTGLAGRWAYQWAGKPSSGLDTTKTQVVWESEIFVSPSLL